MTRTRKTTTTTEHRRRQGASTTSTTERRQPAEPGTLAPAFPPVVGGLGDSLLAAVEDELRDALGDYDLVGGGLQGLTIQDARSRVADLVKARPAVTVVVLGTNNALFEPDDDDVPAVGRMLQELERLPCVRWVEVTESGPTERFNRIARAINAEVRRLAPDEVVPWAAQVAAHPEWVGVDGVHQTAAGEDAFAGVLLDAIRPCFPVPIRGNARPGGGAG